MSRDAVIELTSFTLRMFEEWRRAFRGLLGEDADYETVFICLSVNAIGAEKFMRTGLAAELRTLDQPLPPGMLAPVNLSSIAAATGLNRETVRRRVIKLERLGMLERDGRGGWRIPSGIAASDEVERVVQIQKAGVFRLAARLKAFDETPAHSASPRR